MTFKGGPGLSSKEIQELSKGKHWKTKILINYQEPSDFDDLIQRLVDWDKYAKGEVEWLYNYG